MDKIRIATFNVENLLQRFNFYSYGGYKKERALRILGVDQDDEDYLQLRKSLAVSLTDDSRQQTAQAIIDTDADIVCMQEVENKDVLDYFHDDYLDKSKRAHYGWRRVIDGNDIRGIDVGVMSRERISVATHKDMTFDDAGLTPLSQDLVEYGVSEGGSVFRRDCLEVNHKVDGNEISVFVCHFKSMCGGRDKTRCMREAESRAVCQVIKDKFGNDYDKEDWIIVGDLNDYKVHNGVDVNDHGLKPLFENNFSYNLLENLDIKDMWTHHYSGDNTKHQLDYLLASPSLWKKNKKAKPKIIRKGMAVRVPGIKRIKRYPRVGFDRPKASDHCPVYVDLNL